MNNKINIASIQMFATKSQDENLRTMEEYLTHIHSVFPQIELVVFPELSPMNIGNSMDKEAQTIPGDITDIFSNWARKFEVWLIPGSMYEFCDKNIFNTTPVFSPDGELVGIYRKRYPWSPYEKTKPGYKPFVFKINGRGSVGIMICYDLWFPEVARDLVNMGAEVIIVPTMTTTGDRRQEQIIAQATAITQQSYVVSCNGVGYGGIGGSQIIDPEGTVLQENGEGACIQTATIDFDRVRTVREIGVAGVTTPLKAFRENIQSFSVYK